MAKIIGNTVGIPNPQTDWDQTDTTKADYLKNKPENLLRGRHNTAKNWMMSSLVPEKGEVIIYDGDGSYCEETFYDIVDIPEDATIEDLHIQFYGGNGVRFADKYGEDLLTFYNSSLTGTYYFRPKDKIVEHSNANTVDIGFPWDEYDKIKNKIARIYSQQGFVYYKTTLDSKIKIGDGVSTVIQLPFSNNGGITIDGDNADISGVIEEANLYTDKKANKMLAEAKSYTDEKFLIKMTFSAEQNEKIIPLPTNCSGINRIKLWFERTDGSIANDSDLCATTISFYQGKKMLTDDSYEYFGSLYWVLDAQEKTSNLYRKSDNSLDSTVSLNTTALDVMKGTECDGIKIWQYPSEYFEVYDEYMVKAELEFTVSVIDEVLNEAKTYADEKADEALNEAKAYADEALTSATEYTDKAVGDPSVTIEGDFLTEHANLPQHRGITKITIEPLFTERENQIMVTLGDEGFYNTMGYCNLGSGFLEGSRIVIDAIDGSAVYYEPTGEPIEYIDIPSDFYDAMRDVDTRFIMLNDTYALMYNCSLVYKCSAQDYTDSKIGDIDKALDEIHAYAELLKNGGAS